MGCSVSGIKFKVYDLWFRIWRVGFGALGFGFGDQGFGDQGFGVRVLSVGFKQSLRFRLWGSGFRVKP